MDRAHVWIGRTETFLERRDWWSGPFHVVFADPPYAAAEEIDVLAGLDQPGLLTQDAVIVLEQAFMSELPDTMGPATLKRRYEYGDTMLYLYQCLDHL
jgi:16S rRNA G966 N2-methylase RsmD